MYQPLRLEPVFLCGTITVNHLGPAESEEFRILLREMTLSNGKPKQENPDIGFDFTHN